MKKCIIFIFLIFIGCFSRHHPHNSILRISGSDTMLLLMENLSRYFMKLHHNVSIYVEGGGTFKGVDDLMAGKIDMSTASRLLRPQEIALIAEKYKSIGFYTLIAKDALSVYTHPSNPIKDLTLKQLKQIFSGEILNWQQIGWINIPIKILIRPPNSGTYLYFKEHILENAEYYQGAITLSTTKQIVQFVLNDSTAIGYGGIAYGPDIIHCRINGIRPSLVNVHYDLYPISRYLYLYTIKNPTGITREFVDWILSDEGQKIVKQTGYISLR